MEIQIRPETNSDITHVQKLVAEAFNDQSVAHLLAELRNSNSWRNLSFVASLKDQPVAHIALTRGWLDAPEKLIEVLVLSPVSVAPAYQRKGIGSKLILESIEILKERTEPLIFLEGDPRYYSRLGFQPGNTAGFLKPSVRIPDAAFQFVTLPNYHPSMTGQLVYPDVFWQMDAVGLRP